jgi:hypothetical protein
VNLNPFFTALDPDARIKGSRDPLGFETIWTALGREIIGNLTTVTRSVRQFSTLLYGFYFANQAGESSEDRDKQFLLSFLRFEQLAGYARFWKYGNELVGRDIRGIRAVRRNVGEFQQVQRDPWLSGKREWLILSDQKTYGLYGMFRMAAHKSGLLDPADDKQLSPRAREFLTGQLQSIDQNTRNQLIQHIARDTRIDLAHSPVVKATAVLLAPDLNDAEREFYGAHLVRGSHLLDSMPIQQQLWTCIEAVNTRSNAFGWDREFDMQELHACVGQAAVHGFHELAGKLDCIRRAEELLGNAAILYDFLLTRNKQNLGHVAEEMAKELDSGYRWLNADGLKPFFGESNERLVRLANQLVCREYQAVCRTLIEQNETVMRQRGGTAWMVLKDDDLEVRFGEEGGRLPDRDELQEPWRHTYFLDSLKRVGACVYHGLTGAGEDAAD